MSLLVSSSLAAAAVLVWWLPRPGGLRLADLLASDPVRGPATGAVPAPVGKRQVRRSLGGRPARWLLVLGGPVLFAGLLAGPVAGVLTCGGAVAGRRWWAGRRRARREEAERRGIVQACSLLAAELRAGRTAAQALQAAAEVATGPSQAALRAGASSAGLGGDVAGALAAVPPGCAVPDVLRSLAACWSVCSVTGSGLAAAVDRLEQGLRADQALRQALAAELAGPRATAGLLAVLPVVGLLLAGALGADPLSVLLHTPLGLVCLVGGVGLDVLGVLWTNRLVRRAGG